MLTRKNDIRPFEDGSSLEFLTERNGCSAFAFISHTKKRPHNLVLGRTFDRHTLDQIELAVDRVVVSGSEEGAKSSGSADGAPMFIFKGDAWSRQPELATLQSMILDVFGARAVATVTLKHLDHVTMVTALEREGGGGGLPSSSGPNVQWNGALHWRTYSVKLAVAPGGVPRVELEPSLPTFDFSLRRAQIASQSLRKTAMKQPIG